MARVTLPDGSRRAYYGKTRAEAAQKLLRAQAAIATGLPLAGERLTVGPFLEAWLRDNAAHKVRVKTLVRYRELVRLHIAPVIGRISLTKLTPQQVERMMANVADKGVSPRTVAHCRAVLRTAINYAMRHSLVSRNVAALADAPKVPEPEIRAITPAAARQVLAAVKDDRLEALFTVALACGLRQSEALGLRWGDVDLDSATLRVQRTIQRVDGKYQVLEPKTKRSRRTISLPAPVATSLRQHKARQTGERLRVGPAWEGDAWGGLVFTDEAGRPLSSYHVGRRFRELLAMAELPAMRYHDLRHGAASLMAAQGVPARVAMEVLGHAQISTTMNIYAHVAPEFQKEASERVAAALWPRA
jgi:integrase